jgi:hypothetical protein
MLLSREKITKEMIAMLSTWRHSDFHVFCGARISPKDDTAMEWMAATCALQGMCSHIPNRGEQIVRYDRSYSNVSRGKRQKGGNDNTIPCTITFSMSKIQLTHKIIFHVLPW